MKWIKSIAGLLLVALSATAQLASSHGPAATGSLATKTTAAGMEPAKISDKAIVLVNGVALTDRDLLREEYAMFPYARQHSGVPKSLEPQIRQGALDMIIFEELVYQEARRRGVVIPLARVNRGAADFKSQFPSAAEYQRYLQSECKGSRQVLAEKIRRSMLIEQFMKMEVQNKAAVTVEDARAYFKNNLRQFQVAESFGIQTISIIPPDNATPAHLADARKHAEEIYKQAKSAKSYQEFGLLAEKSSEDDWRVNMGDRKVVGRDKLPPEVAKIAATMQVGEISPLIQLGTAYTIFRLNAHVAAGTMKFEQVRDQLISSLTKDKYNRLRSDLGKRLRQKAKVEVL